MKAYFLILFLCTGICLQAQIVDLHKKPEPNAALHSDSLLRHVVLFKFKDATPGETMRELENAFRALPSSIPEIKDFEWGLNNSPEGLNKGFTHCFILTFASEADRAIYLPHPDHKAFGALLSPWLEDVLVVDYWVRADQD